VWGRGREDLKLLNGPLKEAHEEEAESEAVCHYQYRAVLLYQYCCMNTM
jgi:hypothetical protein